MTKLQCGYRRILKVIPFIFVCITAAVAVAEELPEAFDFALKDKTGKVVRLSDFEGSVVVLEWINPDCSDVRRHYEEGTAQSVYKKYKKQGLIWLAINSASKVDAAENQEFIEKYKVPFPILNDPSEEVRNSYEVQVTPHVVVITREGRIAYSGAIDNDSNGAIDLQHRTLYVDEVIEKVYANETEYIPYMEAYGCRIR